MKRGFLIAFMLVAVSGCRSNNIESKVAGRVREQCETAKPCIIRISDLTDFQWDEMYAFSYSASIDQIEQIIGAPVTEKGQFTRKLVFRWQGKVVHYEELPTQVDNFLDGQVDFDIPNNDPYKLYPVSSAVFRVDQKQFEDGTYYELNQVAPQTP
jgi:hypothetical protein